MNGEGLRRLRQAQERLEEVRSATDPALFVRGVEDVLVDARSAFVLTRRALTSGQPKRAKGRCREWFAEAETAGRDDPLIAWAWDTRAHIQHAGSMPVAHSSHIGYMSTDDIVAPAEFEDATFVYSLDGPWLVTNLGTAQERRVRPGFTGASAAANNVHAVGLVDVPGEHGGAPIADGTDVLGILDLVVTWTARVIDEAQTAWGPTTH
jgi:hypothetical protein